MKRDDLFEIHESGLTPTGLLEPLPWVTAAETQAVFDALEAEGAQARFVGGCVRDGLAKRPVKDVDIATTATPDQVVALLINVGIKVVPTGIDHGTVTAIVGETSFEITTLRVDIDTDGRRATVDFTNDWIADARRRDLTFNAMSATRNGDVYDPFNGIADLSHGRVCFIGHPGDRIAEDYLRILRYFRFQATHGRLPADRDALLACRNNVEHLSELSGERIRDEMLKILSAANPTDIILLMRGEHVLEHILPEAGEVGRLRALTWLSNRTIVLNAVTTDPLRNLAGLLHPDGGRQASKAVAVRWRLSNSNSARLADMTEPLGFVPDAPVSEVRQRLYEGDVDILRDRVLLAWADEVALEARLPRQRTETWVMLLELMEQWQRPVFPLAGSDVLAFGVAPGPDVGKLLRVVEEWWGEQGFPDDRAQCLGKLREITAGLH
jgi:poly(A) polymerase